MHSEGDEATHTNPLIIGIELKLTYFHHFINIGFSGFGSFYTYVNEWQLTDLQQNEFFTQVLIDLAVEKFKELALWK